MHTLQVCIFDKKASTDYSRAWQLQMQQCHKQLLSQLSKRTCSQQQYRSCCVGSGKWGLPVPSTQETLSTHSRWQPSEAAPLNSDVCTYLKHEDAAANKESDYKLATNKATRYWGSTFAIMNCVYAYECVRYCRYLADVFSKYIYRGRHSKNKCYTVPFI